MGHCYDHSGRLCCDYCGNSGGVRKRTCPHRVLGYSIGNGPRVSLPLCPAHALCDGCFQKLGGNRGLHGECKAHAAQRQREDDEIQARLDAGELRVNAAWGDWHKTVPAGMVGVCFRGHDREEYVLLPEGDYGNSGSRRMWLSEYENAQPWIDHPASSTKQVA